MFYVREFRLSGIAYLPCLTYTMYGSSGIGRSAARRVCLCYVTLGSVQEQMSQFDFDPGFIEYRN